MTDKLTVQEAGRLGGQARAKALTPERRKEIAKNALAALTPERRREIAMKAVAAREKKRRKARAEQTANDIS